MNRKTSKYYYLLPVLSVVCLLIGWQLLAMSEGSIIPTPYETWVKFLDICVYPISKATLAGHVWASLKRVLIALLFAVVFGVTIGVSFGWNKTFRAIVRPVFEILRPIPPIAWIPLVILWCGIGELPKIVIVFIGAFVPIVLNTYAGICDIDPLFLKVGKILGANKVQMLIDVTLPAAIPAILAGIRTALSSGWMCVVAAEMIVARQGVGYLIIRGKESGDIALIVANMLVIGVVSLLLSTILSKLEVMLCPWQFKDKS